MKMPRFLCETCGAPVDRDRANRVAWTTYHHLADGTWQRRLNIGYGCPVGLSVGVHMWGRIRTRASSGTLPTATVAHRLTLASAPDCEVTA